MCHSFSKRCMNGAYKQYRDSTLCVPYEYQYVYVMFVQWPVGGRHFFRAQIGHRRFVILDGAAAHTALRACRATAWSRVSARVRLAMEVSLNLVASAALLALILALTLAWWVWRMGNRISQLSREKERLAFERKFALHNLSASRGGTTKEELLTGMDKNSTWPPAPKQKEMLNSKMNGSEKTQQQQPVGSLYAPSSVDPLSDTEEMDDPHPGARPGARTKPSHPMDLEPQPPRAKALNASSRLSSGRIARPSGGRVASTYGTNSELECIEAEVEWIREMDSLEEVFAHSNPFSPYVAPPFFPHDQKKHLFFRSACRG